MIACKILSQKFQRKETHRNDDEINKFSRTTLAFCESPGRRCLAQTDKQQTMTGILRPTKKFQTPFFVAQEEKS